MFVYFIVFILDIILLFIAQESFKKNNKYVGILFSFLSIFVLSLLAGLRTIDIGDDTKAYIRMVYNVASQQNGYSNIIKLLVFNSNFEFLYVTINYLVCYLHLSVNSLYFILEFIPLTFIYKACYDNRDENGNYVFYFVCFMLLFFNKSLNMCRQTIAIAILIYAYKYALDKKLIKYCFFGIIAMGFHISAIVFIPIYFLTQMISNSQKDFKRIMILLLLLVVIFRYQNIINILVLDLKLLDPKYLFYSSNSLGINNIPILEFIFVIIIGLLSVILYYNNKKTISKRDKMYIYFVMMTPILYSLGMIGSYAFRISYFFYYYIIFVIPLFKECIKDKTSKKIMNIIIILSLFTYSYLYYDFIGYDHTTPYQSILTKSNN